MCQTPKKGGCNFLDLQSEIDAFATRWIQRLLDPSEALWKDFVWHKIEELIEDSPIAKLPRQQLFISNLPPKIEKRLKQITGVWKQAFKTYFSIPFKPDPLEDRNIYDITSTSMTLSDTLHKLRVYTIIT